MSNTNTGEPAFPWCGDLNKCPTINLGMTLRDYFAAKAMQSLITLASNPITKTGLKRLGLKDEDFYTMVAQASYVAADEMLKERAA